MATLTPLNADSNLDSSDDVYHTFRKDGGDNDTLIAALDNTDADFVTMDSPLSWTVEYSVNEPPDDDVYGLYIRIVNGATILAAADAGGTFATVDANITSTTDITTGPTAFGYTNTAASKATWDGASVELQPSHEKSKSFDNVSIQVDFVEFTGTYTALTLTPSTIILIT